jgi:hypothetical protein
MVLLNEKVTSSAPSYITMLGAGVVKYFEERALAATPVGNGTIVSGAIKGVIGYAIHHYAGSGQIQDMASMGLTIDAVEDVLTGILGGNVLGGLFGGGSSQANNW